VFLAINKVRRTDTGFSAISNVTAIDGCQKLDKRESLGSAEMLKYMWLIHVKLSADAFDSEMERKLTFYRIHMLAGTYKIAVLA